MITYLVFFGMMIPPVISLMGSVLALTSFSELSEASKTQEKATKSAETSKRGKVNVVSDFSEEYRLPEISWSE